MDIDGNGWGKLRGSESLVLRQAVSSLSGIGMRPPLRTLTPPCSAICHQYWRLHRPQTIPACKRRLLCGVAPPCDNFSHHLLEVFISRPPIATVEQRIFEPLEQTRAPRETATEAMEGSTGVDRLTITNSTDMAPHPLDSLAVDEINIARQVVLDDYSSVVIDFREIFLQEPTKAELQQFLHLEHTGYLSPSTKRPIRLATCQYDVVGASKIPEFHEATVDIDRKSVV